MELTDRIKELEENLRILEFENSQLQKNCTKGNPSFSHEFQELFLNMRIPCVIYAPVDNGEDFKIQDLNPSFETLEGINKNNLIGKRVSSALKNMGPEFLELLQRVYQNREKENFVFQYKNEKDETNWRDNDIFRLSNGNLIAIYDDVSPLKRKESELMNSEARYKALADASNEAVFFMVNALCVDANKTALRMFGFTEEEAKGKHALSIIDEAYHAETIQNLKNNHTKPYDSLGVHKDGRRFPIRIHGRTFISNGQETRITTMRDISEEKEKEIALLISEARYKALANAASEAVFIMENGKCIDLNEKASEIYGYSYTEAIGIPILDLIAPQSIDLVREKFSKDFAEPYEGLCIRKNGEIFPAELRGKNFDYAGKKVRISTVRDISFQKQAELKLAKSEAKFRTYFEEHTAIKLQIDAASMQIIGSNKAAQKFYGYTQEELLAMSAYDLNMLSREEINILAKKATEKKQNAFSFAHQMKNGEIRDVQVFSSPVEVDGRITLFSIIQDITEGKKAETNLKNSQEHLKTAQRIAKVGHFEFNLLTSQAEWSEEVCRIFGFNPQDKNPTYEKYREQIFSEDILQVDVDYKRAKEEKAAYTIFYRIRSLDGEEKHIEENGYFEFDENQNSVKVIGTMQDISTSNQIKNDLEESKAQLALINQNLEEKVKKALVIGREKDHMLIQQSRHAVLGEMIGNIAHQWRQPLNDVSILINDLEDAYSFGVLNKEYFSKTIEIVYKRLKYMSDTINDFSKMHSDDFKKETFKPKELIEKLIQFSEGSIKKNNIQIKFLCKDNFEVFGYPNMLSHVVLNLLNNSRDILLERSIKRPKIWIKIEHSSDIFSVYVLDNGKGIASEVIDKIFDPYFTTKDTKRGSGLGLYMAKSMLEKQMHGRLDVQNQQEGAEFKITLDTKMKDL